MSNGKAPDELLLTAEHLKNGGQTILVILEHLFNSIYMKMDMFRIFLSRVYTYVYKKHGKPLDDPNSYL